MALSIQLVEDTAPSQLVEDTAPSQPMYRPVTLSLPSPYAATSGCPNVCVRK